MYQKMNKKITHYIQLLLPCYDNTHHFWLLNMVIFILLMGLNPSQMIAKSNNARPSFNHLPNYYQATGKVGYACTVYIVGANTKHVSNQMIQKLRIPIQHNPYLNQVKEIEIGEQVNTQNYTQQINQAPPLLAANLNHSVFLNESKTPVKQRLNKNPIHSKGLSFENIQSRLHR
ncbi:MAG: hypothetical protein CL521_01730 [Actinobacteria bacterium]|nr:hypothetical protein [Actinomycetota bacterium]